MKLLSRPETDSLKKRENEKVLDESIRLQKFHRKVIADLGNAKRNYDPDKVKALEDFKQFCKGIDEQKSKKLQELKVVMDEIDKNKEIYYGLVEKSDLLVEKEAALKERENKAELREKFLSELERKQWNATPTTMRS